MGKYRGIEGANATNKDKEGWRKKKRKSRSGLCKRDKLHGEVTDKEYEEEDGKKKNSYQRHSENNIDQCSGASPPITDVASHTRFMSRKLNYVQLFSFIR